VRLFLNSVAAFLCCLCLASAQSAESAELPKATSQILEKLKLSPDIMAGLDKELTVPGEWVDGARREGNLKLSGSWTADQFKALNAPFQERYPFIKFDYVVGSFNERVIRPLVAFKEGRFIIDVITSFGGSERLYQEVDALEDLRSLPGYANPIDGVRDSERGTWVGMRMRYWCVSYNTNKVKKADLPARWEDLLTNPVWRDGNIGVGDRPQLWLLMLWKANGPEWTTDYIHRFFQIDHPQLRKEGVNALVALNGAGEFNLALPMADFAARLSVDKGLPVGWHCPEPTPVAVSQMGIIKGNPHPNASRLWTNWFLSREGQVAQFFGDGSPPAHRALQTREFSAFPDEIKGKKTAIASEEDIQALYDVWNKEWQSAGAGK
jgi:ABC-type Fe3+ transport system substrate-binding protein